MSQVSVLLSPGTLGCTGPGVSVAAISETLYIHPHCSTLLASPGVQAALG